MARKEVCKAVFPAAGLGTRFLPATKAQPKEMMPLVDKPIIQYGVEEAHGVGLRPDHHHYRTRQEPPSKTTSTSAMNWKRCWRNAARPICWRWCGRSRI